MSTIKALVPYRIETFRSAPKHTGGPDQHKPDENGADKHGTEEHGAGKLGAAAQNRARFSRPARFTPFLVQLMASTEADMRKVLGRSEIIEARTRAYGEALARRPSAQEDQRLRPLKTL